MDETTNEDDYWLLE